MSDEYEIVDSTSASKYLGPALIAAAKDGNQKAVKELIQLKVDVNLQDKRGYTLELTRIYRIRMVGRLLSVPVGMVT